MKAPCTLLLILVVAAPLMHAAPTAFDRGNELYAAGKYADSAKAYESQAKSGPYFANLFYNLANADFRLGQTGKAILNYRRALILDPGHAEAASNLSFLRGGSVNEPAPANPWIWCAAAAAWIAVAAFVAGAINSTRRGLAWMTAFIAVCASAGCLCAAQPWKSDALESAAVVLQDKTRASYAPADSSSAVVNLSAGDEIAVLADRGAWLYAQLPNGARGWIPAAQTERLVPSK